ncbi:putative terpene cyclase [Dendrothele bispora CBS 962.96]|uniref:Terpene synthase n=1 Tax=Dendrothele bispora (strain CBS 962.96) TaxID=1314807 RepID=A0A4V4HCF5_DENBC|nr:putative terpene cyclase [Dendrothele bispora CBS 962.96]
MAIQFRLPDILRSWPWPRAVNPHAEECEKVMAQKTLQFEFFPSKMQDGLCQAAIHLASLAYPTFSKAQLQVAVDLMFVFAIFDECSDQMDAASVKIWADIIMDVLRMPETPRSKDEPMIGRLVQSFWLNAVQNMTRSARKQFIEEFDAYTRSVTEQAKDRDNLIIRSVESYLEIRRDDLGAKPAFALILMDQDIPENVLNSGQLHSLRSYTIDMLTLANDVYSYNVEQSKGDNHNIVSIIMAQENLDIQQALERVSVMHANLAAEFLHVYETVCSESNAEAKQYVDGLGTWIRANECFSFESRRYFNKDGLRIQQDRMVELLPKIGATEHSCYIADSDSHHLTDLTSYGLPTSRN